LTIESLVGEFDPRQVGQGSAVSAVFDTPFSKGATTPHSILVLDEGARIFPSNAVGMNGALESRILTTQDGRAVPFAHGVWVAVTDNTNGTGDPTGQYEAFAQDQSFLDRWRTTIEVPFLPEDIEAKVLIAKEGICEPVAKLIIKIMNAFRGASEGAGGHRARALYPSLRGAFALAYGLREGKKFRRAVHQNLIGNAIPADKDIANVLLDNICPPEEEISEVLVGKRTKFSNVTN
jgi:MoxR-like ATPase